jgi:hypothetical protein
MTASLTPPPQEAKVLSAWEGLAHRIAAAEEESATKAFDYDDAHDLAAARSWVASLRRIKGSIERARKDAKAIHLERGRQVDATAKTLEASVAGLIQPHEDAIRRIEAIEEARVAAHRSVLVYIEGLAANVTTSAEALQRLEALQRVDTTTLEEFATAGANRVAEQSERLQELHAQLLQQEADAAELEALRQEKARREEEEAAEALRQEGERRAAARLAAQQEEARRRAEAPAPAPSPAPAPAPPRPAAQQWSTPTPLARPPQDVARDIRAEWLATLVACLKGKTASVVAAELLDGTFHPAISIDTNLL